MDIEELYKEVGIRVKNARISKEMTQDELCSKISLSRASVSNMEVGRHRIQLHVLYQIADVFEMNVHEFIA